MIRKLATKIMCATGDLSSKQCSETMDMPSNNIFLTEGCYKHFTGFYKPQTPVI